MLAAYWAWRKAIALFIGDRLDDGIGLWVVACALLAAWALAAYLACLALSRRCSC